MAHISLVLVGSTVACGNDILLTQLVVAPESTIMYFVVCIAATLLRGDGVTLHFGFLNNFAGESPTAKHMFHPEGVTAPWWVFLFCADGG